MKLKNPVLIVLALGNKYSRQIEDQIQRDLRASFDLEIHTIDIPDLASVSDFHPGGLTNIRHSNLNLAPSSSTYSNKILVSSFPINGINRILHDESSSWTSISVWRIDIRKDFNVIIALIYASVVGSSLLNNHDVYDESCILGCTQYESKTPFEFCPECRKQLPHNGALVSRTLGGIVTSNDSSGHFVLLQHGIRTEHAYWYRSIAKSLQDNGIDYLGFKYGFFGLFPFYFNYIFGKPISNELIKAYDAIKIGRPNSHISFIAHSYGTLILAMTLNRTTHLHLDRVILVNGIIPSNYDWESFVNSGRVKKVLNERGGKDIWPVLAKKIIPNAGDCDFHESRNVINVVHNNADHSSLLTSEHCNHSWIPFLFDDIYQPKSMQCTPQFSKLVRLLDKIPSGIYYAVIFTILSALIFLNVLFSFTS